METGYEVIFITPQNRRYKGKWVTEWIVKLAHEAGVDRMTKRMDSEGQGVEGHKHSAHFFELADQPVEIMFVVDENTAEKLIEAVRATGMPVFLIRKKVEYVDLGSHHGE